MALNTSNVIVGAANCAVGQYSLDYVATGDQAWTAIKSAVGAGKDFRGWITGLAGSTGTPTNVSVVGTGVSGAAYGNVTPAGYISFKDAGLTQSGIEIQYNPDYGEVEVDQLLDTAKLFKQKMTVMVVTTFAEATLQNLLAVWSQEAGTLYTDTGTLASSTGALVSGGSLGAAPIEKCLVFVGNAPNTQTSYKQRVYVATRAISVEQSNHALRRAEATLFPVTFRLLPDTFASYSSYGRVVDIT